MPPASTFILSKKTGKEAYAQPVIEGAPYHFTVKLGKLPPAVKDNLYGAAFIDAISINVIRG